jgi:Arc/MetJ-type ribon-helix-helix transcriptional regulator
MTATVKLPDSLEAALRQRCQQEGRSISDVIRDAVAAYLARDPELDSPWALGQGAFGRFEGPADLAADRKRGLAEVWTARDAARQSG